MTTIAIYGAGPALGMAVARRFGREGFDVALVARNTERLNDMVRELAADGVTAAAFTADIADRSAALAAVDEIEARFGAIDVLEHSPTPGGHGPTPGGHSPTPGGSSPVPGGRGPTPGGLFTRPIEVEVDTVIPLLDLFVLAPIALVGRVLPGMRERGQGGLLFAMGAAAKYPIPQLAAGGIALAAVRSYVHTLNSALTGTGVYAGTLLIGATIENSRAHRSGFAPAIGGRPMPLVSAGDLADRLWDLYTKRDRVEDVVAPALAPTA